MWLEKNQRVTGWDEAQRSITNSNVCGDSGMWYELRVLLGFGFVCVPAYVWRGIFMGVCACEVQTDRWTDRNSQKMKVRYWGYAGRRGKMEEGRFRSVSERQVRLTNNLMVVLPKDNNMLEFIFQHPISATLCLCKINYVSGNKWFQQFFHSVCFFFSLHRPLPYTKKCLVAKGHPSYTANLILKPHMHLLYTPTVNLWWLCFIK